MTATVKVFTISGLDTAANVSGSNLSYDSVKLIKWPYLGSAALSATTGGAVSSDASIAPAGTRLLFIQVQPGKTITYELTPDQHTPRAATANSPWLTGDTMLQFGPGWTISVLEVA